MRLGRDGDVEEWLATDKALDRPVLIRALDPSAGDDRAQSFAGAVRAAARVDHIHLARVYEVSDRSSTYAVLEWNGGVSIADRLAAGDTLAVNEFLPNAAGLADGLAALHAASVLHGAIDTGAIHFSAAHPAKLTAYGRSPRSVDEKDETRSLAVALRLALTGTASSELRPSQVVEGLPRSVDDALEGAERGELTAGQLAATLRSAPYRPESPTEEGWSWGWMIPAGFLLVAALILVVVGLGLDTDPDSPFLFPATPQAAPNPGAPAETDGSAPPVSPGAGLVVPVQASSFDPFGDNASERESDIPLLHDGDATTAWRTERYFSPLQAIKPGVGVVFSPTGPVRSLSVAGSANTGYEIAWAPASTNDLADWEIVERGTLDSGAVSFQLPGRDGGVWLLWLVDLPEQEDGVFFAEIAEVTFGP